MKRGKFWLRETRRIFPEKPREKLKPFDEWLKQFLCRRRGKYFVEESKEKKKTETAEKKIIFTLLVSFLHLLSQLTPPPFRFSSLHHRSLRSSIFLIIFVVDGKTFNLKASLLHPSLCIRILHLNVIIFLLLGTRTERYLILSFPFFTIFFLLLSS